MGNKRGKNRFQKRKEKSMTFRFIILFLCHDILPIWKVPNNTESLSEVHDCECGWPNYGRERRLACRNPLSSINPTVPAVLKEAVSSFVQG